MTEIIGWEEAGNWASERVRAFPAEGMLLMLLFGGDRLACCDEATVAYSKGEIVAIATIAPRGEELSVGKPAIVGVYVVPEQRRKGLGSEVLVSAIRRCVERGLPSSVQIDILSSGMRATVASLPADIRQLVEVKVDVDLLDRLL